MVAPVRGLRPVVALRWLVQNVPKPVRRTSEPLLSWLVMVSNTLSTARAASAFVIEAVEATCEISSCLFTGLYSLLVGDKVWPTHTVVETAVRKLENPSNNVASRCHQRFKSLTPHLSTPISTFFVKKTLDFCGKHRIPHLIFNKFNWLAKTLKTAENRHFLPIFDAFCKKWGLDIIKNGGFL